MAAQRWKWAVALAATLNLSHAWPNGPYTTKGRWIVDRSGANVPLAGVNWPGALESMVPEGLQYQSVQFIVSKIKGLGMNVVRLTYATQMVDEIFDNGGQDIPIQTAFIRALGQDNGTAVYDKVLKNNPAFGPATTRLQVRSSGGGILDASETDRPVGFRCRGCRVRQARDLHPPGQSRLQGNMVLHPVRWE